MPRTPAFPLSRHEVERLAATALDAADTIAPDGGSSRRDRADADALRHSAVVLSQHYGTGDAAREMNGRRPETFRLVGTSDEAADSAEHESVTA